MSRGFVCIGLDSPKYPENIGGVLRAAGCYEADLVIIGQTRCHGNGCTDTQKAWRHIPLIHTQNLKSCVPMGATVVAVDLVENATALPNFVHPERAFYVFGGEDRTLGAEVLEWADCRVNIPTLYCMNLAATVNVVLYDRIAKKWEKGLKACLQLQPPNHEE